MVRPTYRTSREERKFRDGLRRIRWRRTKTTCRPSHHTTAAAVEGAWPAHSRLAWAPQAACPWHWLLEARVQAVLHCHYCSRLAFRLRPALQRAPPSSLREQQQSHQDPCLATQPPARLRPLPAPPAAARALCLASTRLQALASVRLVGWMHHCLLPSEHQSPSASYPRAAVRQLLWQPKVQQVERALQVQARRAVVHALSGAPAPSSRTVPILRALLSSQATSRCPLS